MLASDFSGAVVGATTVGAVVGAATGATAVVYTKKITVCVGTIDSATVATVGDIAAGGAACIISATSSLLLSLLEF